jgi:ribosomal protein L37AE/L43A
VQTARGDGTLQRFAPYLAEAARASLIQRNPPTLQRVIGVIIGSFRISDFRGLDKPTVEATIDFEANYTEVVGTREVTGEDSWYVKERWILERKRDILSPLPGKASAEHCPKCGGALDTRTDGSCAYCGAKIESGAFQWFVRSISVVERENRGPLLTSDVPESGTDRLTIMQPNFLVQKHAFTAAHPAFDFQALDARIRMIATDLNEAWTSRSWEAARAHETDNLFQMHRFWIDEYKRQGLRNAVDEFAVGRVEPVKITSDAFFDSITVRIFASGRDYTVDDRGDVVAGSRSSVRKWSEYWTFIRGRGATSDKPQARKACPNCGAPLDVSASGICNFCGGKLTSGEFDWVLSKIEQDEAYGG